MHLRVDLVRQVLRILLIFGVIALCVAATVSTTVPTNTEDFLLRFGAKCDGVTDDHDALVAAFATKHVILAPQGTCYTSPITFAAGDVVILRGAGPTQTRILAAANSATHTFIATGSVAYFELQDLTFDGNASNQSVWNTGILKFGAAQMYVNHIGVTNAHHGPWTLAITTAAWFMNSRYYDMALHGGAGQDSWVFLAAGPGNSTAPISFMHNVVEQTTAPPGAGDSVQGFSAASANPTEQLLYVNFNTFINIGQDIMGNFVTPIQIYSAADHSEVIGNRIYNSYFGCIKVQRSNATMVAYNTCEGQGVLGSTAQSCISVAERNPATTTRQHFISHNACKNTPDMQGIVVSFSANAPAYDVLIDHNQVDGAASGIYASGVRGMLTLDANTVRNVGGTGGSDYGIYLTQFDATEPTYVGVHNNLVDTAAKGGMNLDDGAARAVSLTLTGNTFANISGSAAAAVVIRNIADFKASENRWTDAGIIPLDYRSITSATVVGNTSVNTTVTRITNGTVVDYNNSWLPSGNLVVDTITPNTLGLDTLRLDYLDTFGLASLGGGLGYQQNLLTYSEQFDNAAWLTGGLSVTANSVNGPDGSVNTAEKVSLVSGVTNRLRQTYASGAVGGRTFSFSFWARAASGTQSATAALGDFSANTDRSSLDFTLTTTWKRYYLSHTFDGATASTSVQGEVVSMTPTSSYDIYVWGGQLTESRGAQAYVPTVAALYTGTTEAVLATNLYVGNGSKITSHLSQAYALNLAAPGAVPGCVDSAAQTLTGVALGQTCLPTLDVAMQLSQQVTCAVSAAGQVLFRVCQFAGVAVDPDGAGANYRADVWGH